VCSCRSRSRIEQLMSLSAISSSAVPVPNIFRSRLIRMNSLESAPCWQASVTSASRLWRIAKLRTADRIWSLGFSLPLIRDRDFYYFHECVNLNLMIAQ
jgi:hypothetical protein